MTSQAKNPTIDPPIIKVKRTRKRLYKSADEQNARTDQFSDNYQEVVANDIVMDHVMWSAGFGLIPLPLLDMAAITLVEMKMLKKLCNHYEIEFSKQRGKAVITSLIGGLHAGLFAGSFLKLVPVFGMAAVILPLPLISGAITYAVGKVFIFHFSLGGTLLDFDAGKMKTYFERKFTEGRGMTFER